MEGTKYLVRLKIGTLNRVRDGKGHGAPMREVNPFTPVLFDHLPAGCDYHGNESFEIIPVNSEDELALWAERITKQNAAALAAAEDRKKRTLEKIKLQMAGGIAAQKEKEETELAKSLEVPGPATIGALIEAEGGKQAEVPLEEVPEPESKPQTQPQRRRRSRGK